MFLHWSTDPLLIDEQPIKYNDWETANSLIEQKGLAAVVQPDHSLTNLYGILIRKIDFVRNTSRDRIIARFPFLVINTLLKEKLLSHLLSLAELVHHYFYKSIDKSILTWKKVIREYLEKGVLPLPVFRCAQELLPDLVFPIVNNFLQLQSARGEAFTFPTKLTSKLAYLCGICNGDGNLRDYWIIVADETKEHIEFISKLFAEMFSKEGAIMKTGGAWIVKLNLLWGARLFNFLTNQAIDEPKYASLREPQIFQQKGESFRSLYWRGAFDSDGSFKKQIAFCTMSENYCKDFYSFLNDIGISSKILSMTSGGYSVIIPAKEKIVFASKIGVSHKKKSIDFLDFLNREYSYKIFQGFNRERITKNNFLDFTFMPTMQVLGLDFYFQNNSYNNFALFSSKELERYKKGFGISISKLTKYLQLSTSEELMSFLFTHHKKIRFRSSSSTPLSLELEPTQKLENIMSILTPTKRGASVKEESDISLLDVGRYFDLKIIRNKIIHKLLSTYLETFGNYKEYFTNELERYIA